VSASPGPRFAGRVALVTGGASGIGAAVVRRLASEGAAVLVVDRSEAAAQALAAALGPRVQAWTADVAREDEVQAAVAAAVQHFGRLDVAVNAAGYGMAAEVVDLTLAQWQGVLDVDLTGVFLCTKHQARQMLRQGGGGAIVNLASTNAEQPAAGLAAYCVAKAGVVMFNRVAALELACHGVRVVGVGPGLTATPATAAFLERPELRAAWLRQVPQGRAAEADEIASLVAWLASPEAAYMSGETVYMDGGLRARAYPTLDELYGGAYAGSKFMRELRGTP